MFFLATLADHTQVGNWHSVIIELGWKLEGGEERVSIEEGAISMYKHCDLRRKGEMAISIARGIPSN